MARRATIVNNLTKGVLDPDLSERIDLQHYYNSLAEGVNLEERPQGKITRRAGTSLNWDADVLAAGLTRRLRRRLEPIELTAGMITAYNGGTAANLVDQDPATLFTTSAVAGDPFVIAEVTLPQAERVCFVDVIGFFAQTITTAMDQALTADDADFQAGTHRTRIPASAIDASGAAVRLTLDAPTTAGNCVIEACYIGRAGIGASFAEKPAQVTFNGGESGVTILASGSAVVSDVVPFAIDASQDLIVSFDVTDTASDARIRGSLTGYTYYQKSDVHEADKVAVSNYSSSGGRLAVVTKIEVVFAKGDAVSVEHWNGSAWVETAADPLDADLNGHRNIGAFARTRRFGTWPGAEPTAASWRVVARNAAGIGAVSVGGLRFWKEKGQLSPAEILAFARGRDRVYELVVTDRNIDVFRGHRHVASIPVPVAPHQIDDLNWTQSLDTALLFHQDIATPVLQRQGAHDEWSVSAAPFTNVPTLTTGAAFSGSLDEVQEIAMPGIEAGNVFVVWLGDMVTAPITYAAASLAADVVAALEALPGVDADGVEASVVDAAAARVRVSFTGELNGGRAWPALSAVVLGRDDVWPEAEIVQGGLALGGPFFGATNGWPRCGLFVQSRLLTAGYRAAPTSWGVSQIGLQFNYLSTGDPLTADLGFIRTLETDQVEIIQQVHVGRHLQIFTDSSEWYAESRTFDATQPPNMVRASGQGIKASVRVSFVDGGSVFIQQGGRVLRDFLWADAETSYAAEPLNLLGAHLLTDVVAIAHRNARTLDEGNMIFMVNADGTLVLLTLLRSQDVIAMCPHKTAGAFRSVAVSFAHETWYVVEREVGGVKDLYLERRDASHPFDAATHHTFGTATTAITGLGHHEGKEVWAYADRELTGPYTVTGGSITLETGAVDVIVGLFPEVSGKLPKFREKLTQDQPFRTPARIYEAELSLVDTGQLQIRANGTAWREVPLTFMDGGTLDYGQLKDAELGYGPELPLLDRLLTGDIKVSNLRGWGRHPTFEFRQTVPAPLGIKAIRLELAMRG